MADKPIAELTITRTESGADSYRLEAAGSLIWNTRAYATVVGRDGARSRMQRWLARHPYEVRRIGIAPDVASSPTDDQEIAFWCEFELVLGGRTWQRVERVLGKTTARPTTLAGWNTLFEKVDAALKAAVAVA